MESGRIKICCQLNMKRWVFLRTCMLVWSVFAVVFASAVDRHAQLALVARHCRHWSSGRHRGVGRLRSLARHAASCRFTGRSKTLEA